MSYRRPLVTALVAAMLIALPSAALAKSYRALRYDVTVTVERGGGLIVSEEVVFRFDGGPFTRVFREVPTRRTDGIRDVRAWLDDQPLVHGDAAGQVSLRTRDRRLRVTWHLASLSDETRTFTLRYRVDGVAFRADDADVVAWVALPIEHDYSIEESMVRISWPESASLVSVSAVPRRLDTVPEVTGSGGERVVNLSGLGKDQSVELQARFDHGTLVGALPYWQQRDRRVAAMRPRALAVAGGVLVALVGLFVLVWLQSPRAAGAQVGGEGYEPEPPDGVPPALAGALASNGSLSAMPLVATLFDLAARNVVRIEEQPRQKWGSRRFTLTRLASTADLRPFERTLVDAIFKESSTGEVDFQKVGGRLRSASRGLKQAVRSELLERRWLDPERDRSRRRLQGLALMVLIVSGISLVVPIILLDRLGPWPLLIPASAALSGVFGLILASSMSPLSDGGQRVATRCRAFGKYLKEVANGKRSPHAPDAWERLVAYAAALGVGAAWAKQMASHGAPSWFHGLAGETDPGASFVAVMSAGSHAAGSSGGGGAAGGAAGGGSSGAS